MLLPLLLKRAAVPDLARPGGLPWPRRHGTSRLSNLHNEGVFVLMLARIVVLVSALFLWTGSVAAAGFEDWMREFRADPQGG